MANSPDNPTILHLPLAPSVNRIWRVGKNKKMYKAPEYTDWICECEKLIWKLKPIPIMGRYSLVINVKRPDKRRRDIDNLIKAVSDLLEGVGLIEGDHLCQEVTARWVEDGPPMEIILTGIK